jgi:alanine racemase
MSCAAEAYISLQALRHNLQRARDSAPHSRVMAVVKANGYGHGLVRVARTLIDADAFGVANLDEAAVLRDAGIIKPVVVLQGVVKSAELQEAGHRGLDIVVHHPYQLDLLERIPLSAAISVWLKVDSGMHRLGFGPEAVRDAWRRLGECPWVAKPVRAMTHLSDAEDRDSDRTPRQLACFDAAVAPLACEISIANSAAVLGWPQTHGHWVRPGLMLYGASPFNDSVASAEHLLPAMTLKTRLIAVNRLKKNDRVGYGGEWVCPEDMPVGVAAVGYGDGYPRHARSGTPVLVDNTRVSLIGRVSMDMICLDLRGLPDARVNDPVVLWGEGLPVEVVARHAATIPYDLLCGVSQRVRILTGD